MQYVKEVYLTCVITEKLYNVHATNGMKTFNAILGFLSERCDR